MPVTRDVALDWEQLREGLSRGQDGRPAAWRQAVDAALDEAQALVSPAIAWSALPVVRGEESRLIVGQGEALESAVVARLFAAAPEVVLMVYTIGPALEARVAELTPADPASGFALDVVGSLAVTHVGKTGYSLIEELARDRGVAASIPLNPGTSHWPMSGQALVARLASAGEIGVEALPSGILKPFKTIAFAVALGRDVLTPDQASSCDYCDNRALCR